MNREIKFRIWILEDKIMGKVLTISFNGDEDDCNVEAYAPKDDSPEFWNGQFHECELMQFTGFKDCDGNDIYDGDIVYFVILGTEKDNKKYNVFFDIEFGAWKVKNQKSDDWWLLCNLANREMVGKNYIKIIGNIYEGVKK